MERQGQDDADAEAGDGAKQGHYAVKVGDQDRENDKNHCDQDADEALQEATVQAG